MNQATVSKRSSEGLTQQPLVVAEGHFGPSEKVPEKQRLHRRVHTQSHRFCSLFPIVSNGPEGQVALY